MAKKQDAIIVDIHGTLLDDSGNVNDDLREIVKCLSKSYYILLLTSHLYTHKQELIDEVGELDFKADGVFYSNANGKTKKDDSIKKYHIYNDEIAPYYNVIAIIDNSKKVIKKFTKEGINTLRFKSNNDN